MFSIFDRPRCANFLNYWIPFLESEDVICNEQACSYSPFSPDVLHKVIMGATFVGILTAILLPISIQKTEHLDADQPWDEASVVSPSELEASFEEGAGDLHEAVASEPSLTPSRTLSLNRRETLGAALQRAGLSPVEEANVSTALSKVLNLRRLQAGQKINLYDEGGFLYRVELEDKKGTQYVASRQTSDSPYLSEKITPVFQVQRKSYEGQIDDNFNTQAVAAGVPYDMVQKTARVFDGPIDFRRDIRKGDAFKIVYEEKISSKGLVDEDSRTLLYSLMDIRGKKYKRYFYKDASGRTDYYDEEGRSIRRLLNITPVRGKYRTSSGFGMRRHPILFYRTLHAGIDYAASIGTPVVAAGDGVVVKMSRQGSYGLYIEIRHNSEYSTAYAHLSDFKSSIDEGTRVKQGQTIAYVGNTGRSTGPHLHLEVIHRGVRVNPLKHKGAAGKTLKGQELANFKLACRELELDPAQNVAALAGKDRSPEEPVMP